MRGNALMGRMTRKLGKSAYKKRPLLSAKFRPTSEIQIPVYKVGRTTFVHNCARESYLKSASLKYPIYNRLPEFWRKEYEFKRPVLHQIINEGTKRPQYSGIWKVGQDGRPIKATNIPVSVYYPKASRHEIWAGEGVIAGYKPGHGDIKNPVKYPRHWKPVRIQSSFYSEILDCHITAKFTPRALDMIDASFGIDEFILSTPTKLLQEFGGALKRKMLLHLTEKEKLYPNNPGRREKIIRKYKKYILCKEDAEWIGLTLEQAMRKQWELDQNTSVQKPLLKIFTKDLIDKLRTEVETLDVGSSSVHTLEMSGNKTSDIKSA